MPAKPKPPRTRMWRGAWYLIYWDHLAGKERRISCKSLDANDADARRKLELEYAAKEVESAAHRMRIGGVSARYNTPLGDALDWFVEDVKDRVEVRKAHRDTREGLSERAAAELLASLGLLRKWIDADARREKVTTGRVDAAWLQSFFRWLATAPARRGNKAITRSGQTVNKHRRGIRTAFRWLSMLRPPLFPDFMALQPAWKPSRVDATEARIVTPAEAQAFLRNALERENPSRVVSITRKRKQVVLPQGQYPGREESFTQEAPSTAATPVSRLFLLLACTGMRLGEALALRWADVDVERGRITIRAAKTGRRRILPLIGAPEGDVAPELVSLLQRWKLEAAGREYVLPHAGTEAPTFPKSAWQCVNADADIPRLGPQHLRQSFVSYCASIGVPSAVAALWSGHSAVVAERHYRDVALEGVKGARSIEAALGLTEILGRLAAGVTSGRRRAKGSSA